MDFETADKCDANAALCFWNKDIDECRPYASKDCPLLDENRCNDHSQMCKWDSENSSCCELDDVVDGKCPSKSEGMSFSNIMLILCAIVCCILMVGSGIYLIAKGK
jgi:hypothetical protein